MQPILQTYRWKPDWADIAARLTRWWRGEAMALYLFSEDGATDPAPAPLPETATAAEAEHWWIDPHARRARAERIMSRRRYFAEGFPIFDTQIGPGSLGLFLGATPVFDANTVWYQPCIHDPDRHDAIRFDPDGNHWWDVHLAVMQAGLTHSQGRYPVGVPDLIENMDTLAALRGTMELLYDLVDRPAWVHARLAEINVAWLDAFAHMQTMVQDADGGNVFAAFRIWGPGRTAKVQCDFSAMISPAMFEEFVRPYLAAQCAQLDFAMYHLDGTNALQHLDILLDMPEIDAIEWTPQAGLPGGGAPEWHDIYRRIKAAGKAVQVVSITPPEVIPLLDAVGPAGMYVLINEPVAATEAEALMRDLAPYRR